MKSEGVSDPLEVLVRVGSISLAGLAVRYPQAVRELLVRLSSLLASGQLEVTDGDNAIGAVQDLAHRAGEIGGTAREYQEHLQKLLNEQPLAARARLTLSRQGYERAKALYGA